MRRFLKVVGFLLFVALVAAGAGAFAVKRLLEESWKGFPEAEKTVDIAPGTSVPGILHQLEREGILRSRHLGTLAMRLSFQGRALKAGEYRFASAATPAEVLRRIAEGDVVRYRVTVPEGLAAAGIFDLLVAKGFGRREVYHQLFTNVAAFPGVPAEAPSLEGFLFPDTYLLTKGMDEPRVLTLMTKELAKRLPAGYEEKARAQGLTLLSAVTLASLVEKETGVGAERALVSAVYRNRLRKGMLLQCDPTTIYAAKRAGVWNGSITRQNLQLDEPYNTYVRPGLPPGPIASPGLAALEAALEPANVPWLYFVATGDGTAAHRFAESYAEHQRNVALYQKARRAARGT